MQQSFNSKKPKNEDCSVLKQSVIRRIFRNGQGNINGFLARKGDKLYRVIGKGIRFEEIPNFSGSTGRQGKHHRPPNSYKIKRRPSSNRENTLLCAS